MTSVSAGNRNTASGPHSNWTYSIAVGQTGPGWRASPRCAGYADLAGTRALPAAQAALPGRGIGPGPAQACPGTACRGRLSPHAPLHDSQRSRGSTSRGIAIVVAFVAPTRLGQRSSRLRQLTSRTSARSLSMPSMQNGRPDSQTVKPCARHSTRMDKSLPAGLDPSTGNHDKQRTSPDCRFAQLRAIGCRQFGSTCRCCRRSALIVAARVTSFRHRAGPGRAESAGCGAAFRWRARPRLRWPRRSRRCRSRRGP